MAALINVVLKDLYCGSSIIAAKYAVTAAHCVRPVDQTGLLVGDHDISTGKILVLFSFGTKEMKILMRDFLILYKLLR